MKTAIRLLAISDLVLFLIPFIPSLRLLIVDPSLWIKSCSSSATCQPPGGGIALSFGDTLLALFIGLLLSIVVVTLSITMHSRRGSRGWYVVFVILTGILVLSPVLLIAGVAVVVMCVLAASASLIALASTFGSEATASS
jgi:hypothetical protein